MPAKTKQYALKWIALPKDFLKFNIIDGAVTRTGDKGAVGVICRDIAENYIRPNHLNLSAEFASHAAVFL